MSPGGAVGGSTPAPPVAGGVLGPTPGPVDPATAKNLMPNMRGPVPMTGPPPGTPTQTGTPTPPKTTGSPIIK
jgi:hypothetical protein